MALNLDEGEDILFRKTGTADDDVRNNLNEIVVALEGKRDAETIEEAFNIYKNDDEKKKVIKIKGGDYYIKNDLVIPKSDLQMIGEGVVNIYLNGSLKNITHDIDRIQIKNINFICENLKESAKDKTFLRFLGGDSRIENTSITLKQYFLYRYSSGTGTNERIKTDYKAIKQESHYYIEYEDNSIYDSNVSSEYLQLVEDFIDEIGLNRANYFALEYIKINKNEYGNFQISGEVSYSTTPGELGTYCGIYTEEGEWHIGTTSDLINFQYTITDDGTYIFIMSEAGETNPILLDLYGATNPFIVENSTIGGQLRVYARRLTTIKNCTINYLNFLGSRGDERIENNVIKTLNLNTNITKITINGLVYTLNGGDIVRGNSITTMTESGGSSLICDNFSYAGAFNSAGSGNIIYNNSWTWITMPYKITMTGTGTTFFNNRIQTSQLSSAEKENLVANVEAGLATTGSVGWNNSIDGNYWNPIGISNMPASKLVAQDIIDIQNLSGTNTGDQDLSGYFRTDQTTSPQSVTGTFSLDGFKANTSKGEIFDENDKISMNFNSRQFYDNSEKSSIDCVNRLLYSTDGTNASVDYNNGYLINGMVVSYDWKNGILNGITEITDKNTGVKILEADNTGRYFYDSSDILNFTILPSGGGTKWNYLAGTEGLLRIDADGLMSADTTAYLSSVAFADLTDYPANSAGVLTNDGAGNLSWGAGGGSVEWGDITGTQTDVNLSGFTNDLTDVLFLDQTSPQSITGGMPSFTAGLYANDSTNNIYLCDGTDAIKATGTADISGQTSLNTAGTKVLFDDTGMYAFTNYSLDVDSNSTRTTAGRLIVDSTYGGGIEIPVIFDNLFYPSINPNNRELIASDGYTINFDWANMKFNQMTTDGFVTTTNSDGTLATEAFGYTGDLNDSNSNKIADVINGLITQVYY